ncbi:hypothetical protein [Mycetocola sp. JXN-3]|uniref:hypothetical protein n=1 Tax=Mycetocola sp. JXN-3 TaxID=2116510 RepID=UPI00165CF0A0|nr:hypothetical protein [Mycetocola sp. JXN-3]
MSTSKSSAQRRAERLDTLGFMACLVGPLAVGVILNALVRPWLASLLGAERHASGNGVRGQDVWWTVDAATAIEHPFLSGFLAMSHGLIAMYLLGVIVLALLIRWAVKRVRRYVTEKHASKRYKV